jgi:hypothetical protein
LFEGAFQKKISIKASRGKKTFCLSFYPGLCVLYRSMLFRPIAGFI